MEYSFLIYVSCIILGVSSHRSKRLTNNNRALLGEFPYMVSIQSNGVHQCGGSLISDRHVLTAAHCVYDITEREYFSDQQVEVGTIDPYKSSTGEKFGVDRAKCHPNLTIIGLPGPSLTVYHDIAVMKLNGSITETEFVKPISLPDPMREYPAGERLIISGFGSSYFIEDTPCLLKKMTTFAVREKFCQKAYGNRKIMPGQMCTISGVGYGVCIGDSGSPVVTINKQLLVGVVSEGDYGGCGTDVPDVSMKVSYYLDFIRHEIKRTD